MLGKQEVSADLSLAAHFLLMIKGGSLFLPFPPTPKPIGIVAWSQMSVKQKPIRPKKNGFMPCLTTLRHGAGRFLFW